MKESYPDITTRIAEPPKWYDQNGTPRYDEHKPDRAPYIYARSVVLLLIECQACKREFKVQLCLLRESTIDWDSPYGDPPAHNTDGKSKLCLTGDAMTSVPVSVLEFWRKLPNIGWQRDPTLENKYIRPAWSK